ncbi:unnamed protein product, partial [Nesidiocoris tenuis]
MSQTSNATYTVDYPVTPMIGESNREGPISFSPEPADYSQSFIDNERSVQSSTVSEQYIKIGSAVKPERTVSPAEIKSGPATSTASDVQAKSDVSLSD